MSKTLMQTLSNALSKSLTKAPSKTLSKTLSRTLSKSPSKTQSKTPSKALTKTLSKTLSKSLSEPQSKALSKRPSKPLSETFRSKPQRAKGGMKEAPQVRGPPRATHCNEKRASENRSNHVAIRSASATNNIPTTLSNVPCIRAHSSPVSGQGLLFCCWVYADALWPLGQKTRSPCIQINDDKQITDTDAETDGHTRAQRNLQQQWQRQSFPHHRSQRSKYSRMAAAAAHV
jgi:hypothetical protein